MCYELQISNISQVLDLSLLICIDCQEVDGPVPLYADKETGT